MSVFCLLPQQPRHSTVVADRDPGTDLMRCSKCGRRVPREGGGVRLIAQAAQATLWGLNGWIWGIVRASVSVGPTRCPAHPMAPEELFICVC